MSQQTINLGTAPNTQDGDPLRVGGSKINSNFTELYTGKQPLSTNLTQLAAIIGQADRLPYFTGVGALSVTVLNALGRSIIGAASQLEARTALGLGTSSTYDRGTANGVASLGADGKLLASQTPDISINDVYPVNSQAAMLALPADQGDIAIRTDESNKPYILGALPASTLANWYPISQTLSPSLAAISALTPANDRIPYYTGANTAALATFNALGRSVVGATDQAAARTALLAAKSGQNADITELTGITTPLSRSQGGNGGEQGFIEGLGLVWSTGTSIIVRPGSAYVPSVGKVVTYAGGTITPQGVVSVNSFIHVYLTATGTIEQDITSTPTRYYNQAHIKGSDNSRRYIASLLVNTNALGVYKFSHDICSNLIMYDHGSPQTVPFKVLTAGTGVGSFTLRPPLPTTAWCVEAAWQNTGTTAVQFTPSDAATAIGSGWTQFVQPGAIWNARCRVEPGGTITYSATGGGSASCYVIGYYFER